MLSSWLPARHQRELICPPPHDNSSQITVSSLSKRKIASRLHPTTTVHWSHTGSKRLPNLKQKMPAMRFPQVPGWRPRALGLSHCPADLWFNSLLCRTPDTVQQFRSTSIPGLSTLICTPWPHRQTREPRQTGIQARHWPCAHPSWRDGWVSDVTQ